MEKNVYMDFGLILFNDIVKSYPQFKANEKPIKNFLKQMIEGQNTVIKKYGALEALDVIFSNEIIKYYSSIERLPDDDISKRIEEISSISTLEGFNKEIEECAILYPSYKYNTNNDNGYVEHIRTFDIYLLKGKEATKITDDNDNNVLENWLPILNKNIEKIAEIWTKDKNATKYELNNIVSEIVALFTVEQSKAFKNDIMEYLADATNDKSFKRFL